jgi:hypothetical protein
MSYAKSILDAFAEYHRPRAWLQMWRDIGDQELRKHGLHWTQNLHKLKKFEGEF